MATTPPYRFHTITEYCRQAHLPKPAHPLLSVINLATIAPLPLREPVSFVTDFYLISLKQHFRGKVQYGQQAYDFDEGLMSFMAPNQVITLAFDADNDRSQVGWVIVVHPDFLWNTALAKKIQQYAYFSYAVHEALHLSEREEQTMTAVIQHLEQEYRANPDRFSQDVLIAHLDVLLTYAERFYQRQFLTRKITNHTLLQRLEELLTDYLANELLVTAGLPTVQYVADRLNVSPNYLSSMLKVLTGQSTQYHIHEKVLEKAKVKLSTTDLSVSEIAYALGFEHPQSFSRLFKSKTALSPLAFRQSFSQQ
jgi:AraC family transcriptional activator of pobA